MTDPSLRLATICRQNGLPVDESQLNRLRNFVALLIEWNSRINLVSRADIENIWFGHILHSISPLFFVHFDKGIRLLDLGSGGGLPGVPLAIVRSDLEVTCVDSIRKKTNALQNIISTLGLLNVRVMNGRAEQLGNHGVTYDVVVSRAVGHLTDLVKWSRAVLAGGTTGTRLPGSEASPKRSFTYPFLLAMKGGDLDAEIEATKIKTGERQVTSLDIVFNGSTEIGLEEKKIVIVELVPGKKKPKV